MKKKLGILVLISMLILSGSVYAEDLPAYDEEEGVIVYEVNSGDLVFAQNEEQKMYPASTTKLMTALVAVEYGDMNELITVGDEINDIAYDSSVAGLQSGETIYMRELMYGLLLPSGNDAAMTIAVNVGRKITGKSDATYTESYAAFIEAMNKEAERLGMAETHFSNPHGLQSSDHYTTPADMLKLAQAAFADQTIASITRSKMQVVTTNEAEHTWYNTNMMLYASFDELPQDYQQLFGVSGNNPDFNGYASSGKTGTTDEAGHCLVFEAEGNGKEVVAVIFNADSDTLFSQASDTINAVVMDYDFINWTQDTEIKNFYSEVKVDNYHVFDGSTLTLTTSSPLITLVKNNEKDNYSSKIKWDDTKINGGEDLIEIFEDLEAGEQVGEIEVYNGENLVETAPIYANNTIGMRTWRDYPIIYWYVTLLVILLLLVILRIMFVDFMRKNNIRYKKIRIRGSGSDSRNTNNRKRKPAPRNSGSSQKRRPSSQNTRGGSRSQSGLRNPGRSSGSSSSRSGGRSSSQSPSRNTNRSSQNRSTNGGRSSQSSNRNTGRTNSQRSSRTSSQNSDRNNNRWR